MSERDGVMRLLEQAERSGKFRVVETHGRGRRLCCLELDNIVIAGVPVDASFDIRRTDHLDNVMAGGLKAKCRVCGAKFWTDREKSSLMDRV